MLTNPLLNLLLLLYSFVFGNIGYFTVVFVLELAVWITEAWALRKVAGVTFRKSMWLSLLFNGASFGLGILIFSFL